MASPVFICILGAPGIIGQRHTEHCLLDPDVVLSCIVDPTPLGPVFASEHGLRLFMSVEDLLQARKTGSVRVDGAILATPNATHVPLGVQLVEAGIHILVEKPMSTSIESGRLLVEAAKLAGSTVLVGQHRRFHSTIVNAKAMLASGILGQVIGVSGLWSTCKPPSYFEEPAAWRKVGGSGGPILINLVHDIDLLRHLFGDIVRVFAEEGASTRGHEVEETGACTLKFRSGAVGTFLFSDATPSPYNFEATTGENPLFPYSGQNVYQILGTNGATSFPELRAWHYPTATGCWTDTLVQDPPPSVDDIPPFTRQLRNFVRVVRGEEEPNCSGEDALRTIITLEAILESMKTGLPVKVRRE